MPKFKKFSATYHKTFFLHKINVTLEEKNVFYTKKLLYCCMEMSEAVC